MKKDTTTKGIKNLKNLESDSQYNMKFLTVDLATDDNIDTKHHRKNRIWFKRKMEEESEAGWIFLFLATISWACLGSRSFIFIFKAIWIVPPEFIFRETLILPAFIMHYTFHTYLPLLVARNSFTKFSEIFIQRTQQTTEK